ncbi:hypothetical protein NCAST_20_02180 [Nocardia asteroides NBRC 15531]|uniref:Uncharacterized protein n=1 Tax=Nocardia asteroides NBRC 15531 TaxID=1110697 RepID=U5EEQ7_NOCAS|nr:hypothetical protein NCAST_20_02180 [Nocardia asteroides NBRC 15531]
MLPPPPFAAVDRTAAAYGGATGLLADLDKVFGGQNSPLNRCGVSWFYSLGAPVWGGARLVDVAAFTTPLVYPRV